ncbi:MAG TPA: hypothetical protein VGO55_06010 [Allosphingosinicella sp.]|jgi:hypothetical protein|nr:hypothetical protein [Allosphingosinicella sp.]
MKAIPLLTLLLAAQPGAALACTIVPSPLPVEEQNDQWARESYSRAEAMVEVVALESSGPHRRGLVRVLRVLKGRIRPGSVLSLRVVESSMCGAGDFERGSRGLILLDRLRGPLVFQGYLPAGYLARLDRLGLGPNR